MFLEEVAFAHLLLEEAFGPAVAECGRLLLLHGWLTLLELRDLFLLSAASCSSGGAAAAAAAGGGVAAAAAFHSSRGSSSLSSSSSVCSNSFALVRNALLVLLQHSLLIYAPLDPPTLLSSSAAAGGGGSTSTALPPAAPGLPASAGGVSCATVSARRRSWAAGREQQADRTARDVSLQAQQGASCSRQSGGAGGAATAAGGSERGASAAATASASRSATAAGAGGTCSSSGSSCGSSSSPQGGPLRYALLLDEVLRRLCFSHMVAHVQQTRGHASRVLLLQMLRAGRQRMREAVAQALQDPYTQYDLLAGVAAEESEEATEGVSEAKAAADSRQQQPHAVPTPISAAELKKEFLQLISTNVFVQCQPVLPSCFSSPSSFSSSFSPPSVLAGCAPSSALGASSCVLPGSSPPIDAAVAGGAASAAGAFPAAAAAAADDGDGDNDEGRDEKEEEEEEQQQQQTGQAPRAREATLAVTGRTRAGEPLEKKHQKRTAAAGTTAATTAAPQGKRRRKKADTLPGDTAFPQMTTAASVDEAERKLLPFPLGTSSSSNSSCEGDPGFSLSLLLEMPAAPAAATASADLGLPPFDALSSDDLPRPQQQQSQGCGATGAAAGERQQQLLEQTIERLEAGHVVFKVNTHLLILEMCKKVAARFVLARLGRGGSSPLLQATVRGALDAGVQLVYCSATPSQQQQQQQQTDEMATQQEQGRTTALRLSCPWLPYSAIEKLAQQKLQKKQADSTAAGGTGSSKRTSSSNSDGRSSSSDGRSSSSSVLQQGQLIRLLDALAKPPDPFLQSRMRSEREYRVRWDDLRTSLHRRIVYRALVGRCGEKAGRVWGLTQHRQPVPLRDCAGGGGAAAAAAAGESAYWDELTVADAALLSAQDARRAMYILAKEGFARFHESDRLGPQVTSLSNKHALVISTSMEDAQQRVLRNLYQTAVNLLERKHEEAARVLQMQKRCLLLPPSGSAALHMKKCEAAEDLLEGHLLALSEPLTILRDM